jgi:hypothetical protein
MAKKKPASKTAAPKAPTSRTAGKGRSKTVSVKRIVAEIDRTLAKLEPAKAVAAKRSPAAGADPQAYALDRAIMQLRGAREVMKGVCVPGFDIPI